ncbi:MAG: molybdopterin converting factor subunit 1 [Gammaproteobacteria bacterium]
MIKILYFAKLSESLCVKSEDMEYGRESEKVEGIIRQLIGRGEPWASEFSGDIKFLVAVNQEMCERDTAVSDGDEVAFFPPVTGG